MNGKISHYLIFHPVDMTKPLTITTYSDVDWADDPRYICKEYKILNKIFTTSFGNTTNNNIVAKILTTYFNPLLSALIFNCRYFCYILTLTV